MKKKHLSGSVKNGITAHYEGIVAHIDRVTGENCYKGIEDVFSKSLLQAIGSTAHPQRDLKLIGAKSFKNDLDSGRAKVDIAIGDDPAGPFSSAFELKAVRMPRKKSSGGQGCLFDIGQMAEDYHRLSSAKKCDAAWVIAYVYGPMVDDATSNKDLYRRFHNQMFVDYAACDGEMRKLHLKYLKAFGWNEPKAYAEVPEDVFSVLYRPDQGGKALGAIGYLVA